MTSEREKRESDIMRYFPVVLKLKISARQRSIAVSLEVRIEAELRRGGRIKFEFIEKHADFVQISDPSVKHFMNLGYSSRMKLRWVLIDTSSKRILGGRGVGESTAMVRRR